MNSRPPTGSDGAPPGPGNVLALLPMLVALADTGQVTAAAEVLGIRQPTLTRALQRAELSLGVPLHEKDGRGVRLTAAGEAFVPYAREALAQVEAGLAAAGAVAAPVRGRVSIAFQNILGEDLVPALVRSFRGDYPDVEFVLAQGARAHCLELLTAGRADVAFISPPPEDAGLSVVPLGADELVLVVPPDHRLARRATVQLSELADERFVLTEPGFGLRSAVQDLLRTVGIRATVAFEGQDIHTLVGLVSAGLGVTIVPRRNYPQDVRMLRIVGVRAQRDVVMIAPPEPSERPAVAAFRELVASRGAAIQAGFAGKRPGQAR